MYASGPRTMTIASPIGGVFHWRLFRATWPISSAWGPDSGDGGSGGWWISGSIVASSRSAVAVTRSAAPMWARSSATSSLVGRKWSGMYTPTSMQSPAGRDRYPDRRAGVAEQADAAVLNTADRKIVRVRTPAPAPRFGSNVGASDRPRPPCLLPLRVPAVAGDRHRDLRSPLG